MFKFVNELSNEIEDIESLISDLRVPFYNINFFRKKLPNMKVKEPTSISTERDTSRS